MEQGRDGWVVAMPATVKLDHPSFLVRCTGGRTHICCASVKTEALYLAVDRRPPDRCDLFGPAAPEHGQVVKAWSGLDSTS